MPSRWCSAQGPATQVRLVSCFGEEETEEQRGELTEWQGCDSRSEPHLQTPAVSPFAPLASKLGSSTPYSRRALNAGAGHSRAERRWTRWLRAPGAWRPPAPSETCLRVFKGPGPPPTSAFASAVAGSRPPGPPLPAASRVTQQPHAVARDAVLPAAAGGRWGRRCPPPEGRGRASLPDTGERPARQLVAGEHLGQPANGMPCLVAKRAF